MFFEAPDLILKEKIKLYNNIANSGDCTGRLDVELQVFPSPRINWKFESLGEKACEPEKKPGAIAELMNPFIGVEFVLEEPYVHIGEWGRHRKEFSGAASQARFGTLDTQADRFAFYLPNAQFQKRNPLGQSVIKQTLEEIGKNKVREIEPAGLNLDARLDNIWNISLETRSESLDWLDPNNQNIGTLITTECLLYHPGKSGVEGNDFGNNPNISLRDAHIRISAFCSFLSFANGGYLGPAYIEGTSWTEKKKISSAIALQYKITPLEQLGTTWLAIDSNLGMYIQRFGTFQKMLETSPWDETYGSTLAWYFQAIQPINVQIRGKPVSVVANAVGAALERLCYAILIIEEEDPAKRKLNEQLFSVGKSQGRLGSILERIGITRDRGYDDVDFIKAFIEIRNEATHPKPSAVSRSTKERNEIIHRAIQWVEEVMLWRIGYAGKYIDRSKGGQVSTAPRYDLSLRNPKW